MMLAQGFYEGAWGKLGHHSCRYTPTDFCNKIIM
jgi:hypothetical protein